MVESGGRSERDLQQKRVAETFAAGPFDDEHVRPVIHRLFAIEKERRVARVLMLVRMYRGLRPRAAAPNLFAGLSSGKE